MLQGALIDAESGDTVCLKEGRFKLTRQITLSTDGVTVRGEEGTVLDFSEQTAGANGFEISANHDTLESVRIENPKGDGVRATEVDSPTIRDVEVVWTGGPSTDNGGYGIYPVLAKNVLVEDCFASGASDAGIYVGQSKDIVIRNNEVTENVAGIETASASRSGRSTSSASVVVGLSAVRRGSEDEKHFAEVDHQIWTTYGMVQPIHVLTYDGGPIISVYKILGVRTGDTV